MKLRSIALVVLTLLCLLLYQVGLFYLYFLLYELYQCKRGNKSKSGNVVHFINIGIYILQMAFTFIAYNQFPVGSAVDDDTYINYKTYAELTVLARYLSAINSLFVWFEVIQFMALVPAFALVLGELTFPKTTVSRLYFHRARIPICTQGTCGDSPCVDPCSFNMF